MLFWFSHTIWRWNLTTAVDVGLFIPYWVSRAMPWD
jgi:hypothetical protein